MISILCSNYNSSDWIDDYLAHLDRQDMETFEVIFVDAKSTDDSLEKIKNHTFRKGIDKKIVECEKRIGVYEAWNIAIGKSTQDYVMNYNTDDRLLPHALTTLYTLATYNPHASVVYCNCAISDEPTNTRIIGQYNWDDANEMSALLRGCCCGPFPLLKKEAIVKGGMFHESFQISGDYEMWCRLNSKGHQFLKTNEILGVYFNNPEGVSTQNTEQRLSRHIQEDNAIRSKYS